MNPTQAKFQEDLDRITNELNLGVERGEYTWADVQERLKTKTSRWANATDQYVHEHAWSTLGVAAALGMVVGLLVGRR